MEESFYLVPISNNNIYVNDIKLRDLLQQYYSKIYELVLEEEYVIQKIYESNIFSISEKINELYNIYKIPNYFIIVEDEGEYIELATKLSITIDNKDEILNYKISDVKRINEYYFKNNYKDKIINLFRMYGFLNRKGVLKRRLKK